MKNRHEQFLFEIKKMICDEIDSVTEYRYLCDQGQGKGEDEYTQDYINSLEELNEYILKKLIEIENKT